MHVGVIGLGLMGHPMAERLLAAGHTVYVWNRTREKAGALLAQGAHWGDSPAGVAARCEVVLSIVTDPAAVERISMAPDGVLAALPSESVHCDMSTVAPAWARRMAQAYRERGRRFVQSPVLGSKRQIEEGVLLVFGGGAEEDVRRCEKAWRAFASRVWTLPAPDQAATLKLACNMLIAHMILGLGQSMLFGQQGAVAPSLLLEVLQASAMGCPMYASKGGSLLKREFGANFVVRNMLKDLSLATDAGRETGAPLPFTGLAREMFIAADRHGWGEEDYSAVVKVLELMTGVELNGAAR